jgi:3-dehydroquinate synthetase
MEAICHYLFQHFNLPAIPPFCHRDLVGKMRADKKNTGTAIRCVLLSAVGKPHFGQVVTEAEALDALLFYHEYLYNHIVCH